MNWVLIVVLAALVGATLLGMKKGLVKMVFSLVSLILTIVLVFILAPKLSSFVKENTKIYQNVEETVGEKIVTEKVLANIADKDALIDKLDLPEVIKDYLKKSDAADKAITDGTSAVRSWLVTTIASVFFTAGVFVVTFVIVFIGLRIVVGLLDILTKLPFIHGANKWAGGAVGFFMALFAIWFVLCILTMFGSSNLSVHIFEQVNSSKILTFISDNNIFLKYVQAIVK